jgi:hypothetical protein
MKKFSAGVVLGFLASLGIGFAAPNFSHNGDFWNKLDTSAKSGYVNGYSDAMEVSAGKLDSLTIAAGLFHWKGADKIISQLSKELSTADLSHDDAMRQLDVLYSNSKYSELDLGQALQLLAAKTPTDSVPASAGSSTTQK